MRDNVEMKVFDSNEVGNTTSVGYMDEEFKNFDQNLEDYEVEVSDTVERRYNYELVRAAISYFEKKKTRINTYRDLIFYLLWISLYLSIVLLSRDIGGAHRLEAAIKEVIVDEELPLVIRLEFIDIGQIEEFWDWMEGPLLRAISETNSEEEVFVTFYNRLLGSVRLRQVRVRDDSCDITPAMAPFVEKCYGTYSADNEAKEPFGPGGKYKYTEDSGSPTHWGVDYTPYGPGGYIVDLPYNPIIAAEVIDELQEDEWFDQGTRAVLITLNLYNPNMNMFSTQLYLVEYHGGGGFWKSWNFRTFKADLYLSGLDYFRLFLEILFLLGLCLWAAYTIWQIKKFPARNPGESYISWFWNPWWNITHVLSLVIFLVTAGYYIAFNIRLSSFRSRITDLNQDTDFTEMENLGFDWLFIFNLTTANVMLSVFTVFKYLNVSARMNVLWKTLEKAGPDLLTFLVFFFIVFMGFVISGHLMFGGPIGDFRNMIRSFFACFRMLMGDLDFEELESGGNRILAPMYIILFVILIPFILINMFLAIVNNSYDEVVDDLAEQPTLGEVLRKMTLNFKRRLIRLAKKSLRRSEKERGQTRAQLKKMMFDWDEGDRLGDRLAQFKDHGRGFTIAELQDLMDLDTYEISELQRCMDKYIEKMKEKIQRAKAAKESPEEATVYDLLKSVNALEARLDGFIVETYGE